MTDKEFELKIKEAVIAAQNHFAMVKELDIEYQRRFGFPPDEEMGDFWICCVYFGRHIPTLDEVAANAKRAIDDDDYCNY